jgi:Ca-activated chloride channel family protein
MKHRGLTCFALTLTCVASGLAACSMADEDMAMEGGDWTGSSSGSSTSGGPPPPVAPPISDPDDPETVTCEELDETKPLVLYLSADDSNSMASPALARALVSMGGLAMNVRVYEFLNYYAIDYPAPPLGDLSIIPQMEAGAVAGEYDFQIAVRAFDPPAQRRPMTLTFVLDTSGSMGGVAIQRERAVVKAVAESLQEGDIVSMVTWSTQNAVVMSGHTVTGPNDPALIDQANALTEGGGTDLNGGLVAGYDLANLHYGPNRLNRLMLISDGGANAGVVDPDLIANNSKDGDQEGIYLVGVGTGPAQSYSDALMDTVTDQGRGAYVYIDSLDEARHMFVDRFDEVMEVAARGVQVELTLPWYFQMHRFYGEEYSENPEEVDPQHLAPGDAMIFNQVIRACDPEAVIPSDEISIQATWETPLTYETRTTATTLTVAQLLDGDHGQLHKGKAIVAYAEALRTGTSGDLHNAFTAVDSANPGADPELSEIADLIKSHPAY